jgi:hypothetical protein
VGSLVGREAGGSLGSDVATGGLVPEGLALFDASVMSTSTGEGVWLGPGLHPAATATATAQPGAMVKRRFERDGTRASYCVVWQTASSGCYTSRRVSAGR